MFIEEIKYNGNESNEKDADLTDLRKMAVSREQQQLIDCIDGGGTSGGGGADGCGCSGGGGNSLHVVMTTNDGIATLDKTYNEIIAALEASKYVYLTNDGEYEGLTIQSVYGLSGTGTNGTDHYIVLFNNYTFDSTSADGVLSMSVDSPMPGN